MGRSTLLSQPEVVATAVPTAVSTAVPTTVPVPKHDQNNREFGEKGPPDLKTDNKQPALLDIMEEDIHTNALSNWEMPYPFRSYSPNMPLWRGAS